MKNGDRIRMMSDPELADFMRQCEREEVVYYQYECKECVNRNCDECRIKWLGKDPDIYTDDPDTFEIVLKVVNLLFPTDGVFYKTTLASELYKKIRKEHD